MNSRPFSKTTPLTDLLNPKTKYGENNAANIIQKARAELTNELKSGLQHSSKLKPPKSKRVIISASLRFIGENLTPVIHTRIDKDDLNANRSQSATDSNTRKVVNLADIHTLNAENMRKLNVDLPEESNSQTSEEKFEANTSEGSNPSSANNRSPKKFIIKHKRTPSQELKGNSKRNSIDSTKAPSITTANAQGSHTTTEKSRKSSNVSEDEAGRPQDPEDEEEMKYKENGIGIKSPQLGNLMGAESFYSIEENKSEKSNSDSFQTRSKNLKNKGGQAAESGNESGLVGKNDRLKGNTSLQADEGMKNESMMPPIFTSIMMGTAEIKFGDQIGEGAYGVVYKALNVETGKFIAVKHIKMANVNLESSFHLENLSREIEVYQKLEHENIVRYLGYKQIGENIFINMEYMPGGSVSSMLKQYDFFEEKVIKKFTKQVLQGLIYLHEKGVIHRDIKGGNILSDGAGNVKLADFGASKHIENIPLVNLASSEICNSIKGSLYWMAPELFKQEKHGRKIDIWSLGCTIIEMATAFHPWPDCKSYPELALSIMTKKCPPIPDHLSDKAKEFIRLCCNFDKKSRPRAQDLLNHPFLTD